MKKYNKTYKGILALILFVIAGWIILKYVSPTPYEVWKYKGDWPTANQNYDNTRETKTSAITSKNVSSLGLSWSYPIKGVSEWGAAATNPLILGDTVYFQDLKSNIYAIDLLTGKEIWSKLYNLDTEGPNGLAIGYGKIYAVKGHYQVASLDLKGNEVWSKTISDKTNIGIDIQPAVYDQKIFLSTVPGVSNQNFYKGGSIGVLYALDAKTGDTKWSFDTVDTPDIWGNPTVNSGGGAWYPPAVDTKTGMLYWGIGNPAPWPGTKEFPNGTSRMGPNLYTGSLLAIDSKNGNLNWYTQVQKHDLFDYDLQVSPVLATANINNVMTDIILGAGKMGKVFAFDRKNGNVLWQTKVGTHLNDELTTLPNGITKVSPSPLGGIETNLAYSDGMVYAAVVNLTVEYTPSEFVSKSFDLAKGKGEIVALDVANGKIVWNYNFDSVNVGAATVVNDLVFTATYDGKIYAFNKKTGEKLFQFQTAGGINGWPAVKGDTIIFPVGVGKSPQVVALRLGATGKPVVPSVTPVIAPGKQFQQ